MIPFINQDTFDLWFKTNFDVKNWDALDIVMNCKGMNLHHNITIAILIPSSVLYKTHVIILLRRKILASLTCLFYRTVNDIINYNIKLFNYTIHHNEAM